MDWRLLLMQPGPVFHERLYDAVGALNNLHFEPAELQAIEQILARTGLAWQQVCYVGDDLVDLGAMSRAGVAVAVANAVAEARAAAHYVTKASGGNGAVREVVEIILKAQNKWNAVVADYKS